MPKPSQARRRRQNAMGLLLGLIILAVGLILAPSNAPRNAPSNTVTDVSWPNCTVLPAPEPSVGIVGVNGGLDFHPNRCLYSESRLFTSYELYLNTGYPGTASHRKFTSFPRACGVRDTSCLAYNYGYNAAHYALNYASTQAVHASTWWLDVENGNSWTDSTQQNRASLIGMIAALRHYTFLPTVGFYSYPGQWNIITGKWKNGYPVWVATGSTHRQDAVAFCKNENFTGGSTWLSQYTVGLDHNYICPGYPQPLNF